MSASSRAADAAADLLNGDAPTAASGGAPVNGDRDPVNGRWLPGNSQARIAAPLGARGRRRSFLAHLLAEEFSEQTIRDLARLGAGDGADFEGKKHKVTPTERIMAHRLILAYGLGMPRQTLLVSGGDSAPDDDTVVVVDAVTAALERMIATRQTPPALPPTE